MCTIRIMVKHANCNIHVWPCMATTFFYLRTQRHTEEAKCRMRTHFVIYTLSLLFHVLSLLFSSLNKLSKSLTSLSSHPIFADQPPQKGCEGRRRRHGPLRRCTTTKHKKPNMTSPLNLFLHPKPNFFT